MLGVQLEWAHMMIEMRRERVRERRPGQIIISMGEMKDIRQAYSKRYSALAVRGHGSYRLPNCCHVQSKLPSTGAI